MAEAAGARRHDAVLREPPRLHLRARACAALPPGAVPIDGVFEEFRSRFFGRSGIQFWWGAFDFAVLLFNGKHEAAPDDKGYIMRYDLDAEHINAGFWPGDDSAPTRLLRLPGAAARRVRDGADQPEHAGWVEAMGEWMMPYDAVRTCEIRAQALLDFLAACTGWR